MLKTVLMPIESHLRRDQYSYQFSLNRKEAIALLVPELFFAEGVFKFLRLVLQILFFYP